MRKLITSIVFGVLAVGSARAQQHSIVQTSLSAAITQTATRFNVAAATGINAPSYTSGLAGSSLYVVDPGQNYGELMTVTAISGTTVSVSRTTGPATPHVSGAMVLVATAPNWFYTTNPHGACTTASVYASPWVNVNTGEQWLCSSKTLSWVAGWGAFSGVPALLTNTAYTVPSGAAVIGGPLIYTDTGTNAATSFTMSTGWNGQGFCVIPGGAFTGTATNNIEKAFTAVADRTLCFTYNVKTASFAPSY